MAGVNEQVAKRCADRIRAYWAERGHKVRVSVRQQNTDRDVLFPLKSDMVDGLPKSMKRHDG